MPANSWGLGTTKTLNRQSFIRATKRFLVLLSLALILVACSPANRTAPGAAVDYLGRSVNIEEIPQKIVSLAPSNAP